MFTVTVLLYNSSLNLTLNCTFERVSFLFFWQTVCTEMLHQSSGHFSPRSYFQSRQAVSSCWWLFVSLFWLYLLKALTQISSWRWSGALLIKTIRPNEARNHCQRLFTCCHFLWILRNWWSRGPSDGSACCRLLGDATVYKISRQQIRNLTYF